MAQWRRPPHETLDADRSCGRERTGPCGWQILNDPACTATPVPAELRAPRRQGLVTSSLSVRSMKTIEIQGKTMATADPGRVRERAAKARSAASGRLRIGDDWNAITIIALSQDNQPLEARCAS